MLEAPQIALPRSPLIMRVFTCWFYPIYPTFVVLPCWQFHTGFRAFFPALCKQLYAIVNTLFKANVIQKEGWRAPKMQPCQVGPQSSWHTKMENFSCVRDWTRFTFPLFMPSILVAEILLRVTFARRGADFASSGVVYRSAGREKRRMRTEALEIPEFILSIPKNTISRNFFLIFYIFSPSNMLKIDCLLCWSVFVLVFHYFDLSMTNIDEFDLF